MSRSSDTWQKHTLLAEVANLSPNVAPVQSPSIGTTSIPSASCETRDICSKTYVKSSRSRGGRQGVGWSRNVQYAPACFVTRESNVWDMRMRICISFRSDVSSYLTWKQDIVADLKLRPNIAPSLSSSVVNSCAPNAKLDRIFVPGQCEGIIWNNRHYLQVVRKYRDQNVQIKWYLTETYRDIVGLNGSTGSGCQSGPKSHIKLKSKRHK